MVVADLGDDVAVGIVRDPLSVNRQFSHRAIVPLAPGSSGRRRAARYPSACRAAVGSHRPSAPRLAVGLREPSRSASRRRAASPRSLRRPRRGRRFVLASPALAFAEVVAVSHALSSFDAYERTGSSASLALVAVAAAVAAGDRRGRPARAPRRLRSVRPRARRRSGSSSSSARGRRRELGLPARARALHAARTTSTSLTYHLTRAVFWIQQGSVARSRTTPTRGSTTSRRTPRSSQGATMLLSGSRPLGRARPVRRAARLDARDLRDRATDRLRPPPGGVRRAPLRDAPGRRAARRRRPMNDLVVAALVASAVFFALGRTHRRARARVL